MVIARMLKKILFAVLSWLIEVGIVPQTNVDSSSDLTPKIINMTEGHKLITNRGLLVQKLRIEEFERFENAVGKDATMLVAPQTDLKIGDMEKCWRLLSKCMARKELIDTYALSMVEYLFELRDIVLQIEYINSFCTEGGVDMVLENDRYAQKMLDIAYNYHKKHNLKTVEYHSKYFKEGFYEFDDIWKFKRYEIINEHKACGLVTYCLENFEVIRKKYPISMKRIKILTEAAELSTKSALSNDDRSILKVISQNWIAFKNRNTKADSKEKTFFDIRYDKFNNDDIKAELESIDKSKIRGYKGAYLHKSKSVKEKLGMKLGYLATIYVTKILRAPKPFLRDEDPLGNLSASQAIEYISETSAFFPPYLASYEVLYDTKLSFTENDLTLDMHLFRSATIKHKNEIILNATTFSLDSSEIFDDVGWNFESIEGFTFTNDDSPTPKYLKVLVEYGGGKDRLSNLKVIPKKNNCFTVTLITPTAFSKIAIREDYSQSIIASHRKFVKLQEIMSASYKDIAIPSA